MERQIREEEERVATADALSQQERNRAEEERRRKFEIVERIRHDMQIKDAAKKVSLVDSYAVKA
jgi:hypothetical protein